MRRSDNYQRRGNTFGVKVLQTILLLIILGVLFGAVLFPLFSIAGPILAALPFSTPLNFIIVDYLGMAVMAYAAYQALRLSLKWGWR